MITLEAAPSNKRQKQRLAKEFIKSVAKIMKMLEGKKAIVLYNKTDLDPSDNMGAGRNWLSNKWSSGMGGQANCSTHSLLFQIKEDVLVWKPLNSATA